MGHRPLPADRLGCEGVTSLKARPHMPGERSSVHLRAGPGWRVLTESEAGIQPPGALCDPSVTWAPCQEPQNQSSNPIAQPRPQVREPLGRDRGAWAGPRGPRRGPPPPAVRAPAPGGAPDLPSRPTLPSGAPRGPCAPPSLPASCAPTHAVPASRGACFPVASDGRARDKCPPLCRLLPGLAPSLPSVSAHVL